MPNNLSEQHGLIQKIETPKSWTATVRGEAGYVTIIYEEVDSQLKLRTVLEPGQTLRLRLPHLRRHIIRKISIKGGLLPVGLLISGNNESFLLLRVIVSYLAIDFANLALQEDPLRVLRSNIINRINTLIIADTHVIELQAQITHLLENVDLHQTLGFRLEVTLVETVQVNRRVLFESDSGLSELINDALAEVSTRIASLGPVTPYSDVLIREYLREQFQAVLERKHVVSLSAQALELQRIASLSEIRLSSKSEFARALLAVYAVLKPARLLLTDRFFRYRDLITGLHVDTAAPEEVTVGEVFDLAVLVRPKDSLPLRIEDLPRVVTGEALVHWPKDQPFISLHVKILAPDCSIHGNDRRSFRLYIGRPSLTLYFHLTPHKAGKITITVEVYQENDAIGSTRIHTIAIEQPVGIIKMDVISQPLTQTTNTTSELSPQYIAFSPSLSAFNDSNVFAAELLHEKIRRLQRLEVVSARMGHNTPPEVLNEIEDLINEITRLRNQLGTQTMR